MVGGGLAVSGQGLKVTIMELFIEAENRDLAVGGADGHEAAVFMDLKLNNDLLTG